MASGRVSAPRAVVFDLDGTLIDSRGDIARACNHTLERAGRRVLDESTIAGFVGDGARLLLARAFETEEVDLVLDGHLEVFLDFYTAHPTGKTNVYPGVVEALRALSGRPLAVCTNKPRRTTDAVLAGLDMVDCFQSVVAGGDTVDKKPAPGPLRRVAAELGVPVESLIMVGDGPQDVLAARAVGAHAIGVRGGLLPLYRLTDSNPDVLLDGVGDVPEYLDRARL